MKYEMWLEIELGWATALIPVRVIDEEDLECLGCPLFGICPLWAVPDEFPTDLVGSLVGRGDLPSDEVEPEVERPEFEPLIENGDEEGDVDWPEVLEQYLNTWTKWDD